MPGSISMQLADKPDDKAPYFAIVLVAGWSGRPGVMGMGAKP
jgi:precorrin-2/cobalt-factor-2 C20-methyltransferase